MGDELPLFDVPAGLDGSNAGPRPDAKRPGTGIDRTPRDRRPGLGSKTSQAKGTAHRFDTKEAAAASRKGVLARQANSKVADPALKAR